MHTPTLYICTTHSATCEFVETLRSKSLVNSPPARGAVGIPGTTEYSVRRTYMVYYVQRSYIVLYLKSATNYYIGQWG